MKYSIIIPYRDYEIIISEQNDTKNFKISCVENVGYKHATGDVLIFHQVDYIPTEDVSYELNNHEVVLPHARGIFVGADMTPRPIDDIPAGYRMWRDKIDPNFFGGIIVVSRKAFETINGYNPMYVGWGNEDEDIRERFKWANIPTHRNEKGTFHILYHVDNHPKPDEQERLQDFRNGQEIYRNSFKYKHVGFDSMTANVEVYDMPGHDKVKWIKSNNYKLEGVEI